jgi:hypothetical protein
MTIFLLLLGLSTAAFAQSDAQIPFAKIKTLAGTWEGVLTTTPPAPDVQGKLATITIRVTSSGNAVLHEVRIPGREDDPITMFYLDSQRLLLTHYCDAGNRPRMVGKMSADGKAIDFSFLDIAGDMKYHMHHSLLTLGDENHHSEDWTFMVDNKPVVAHFDLQRVK